ncbi:Gmad2 immunoglobulin-like domain-containing protein [Nocardioides antri]|uniref:Uncharacterized protein n=1 Tax=Nocardioides antri TaxID=2607659 RepID=A0A5B1M341_9ACTN|nr:Gmad2 immunoglobulin-like domain-containing protein [Nocardioides antri]KAA1426197.1 hypothetical protein F0U47_14915 [Nocardioides antri]
MKRHTFPLAITATLAALVLTACGEDEPSGSADDPASSPTQSESEPTTSAPVSTPTESPTTSDTATAETVEAPIFFAADTANGQGLFAEVRTIEADNPLEEAAAIMVAGDANDPDYRTLFPAGSFESIEYDGEKFVVTVPDDGWSTRAPGMSKADAELAVQQLVYTLQAVEGAEVPVVVAPTGLLFGVDASTIGAADELDVRGLVNVLSPGEGETVSGSFTASGEASSFEATVPWEVRDETGATVLDGFATAEGWLDGLYPWETEVDVSGLEPGTYTFVAMTDDPSGGTEGHGPTEDTKTIVVE